MSVGKSFCAAILREQLHKDLSIDTQVAEEKLVDVIARSVPAVESFRISA